MLSKLVALTVSVGVASVWRCCRAAANIDVPVSDVKVACERAQPGAVLELHI